MNRDELRDLYSSLLDDELSPQERAGLEALLANDAEALREIDAIKRVDALYRALPSHKAPADFENRIREALQRYERAGRGWRMMRVWGALAVAALVLVVAGGVLVLQQSGQFASFNVASAPSAESMPDLAEPASTQSPRRFYTPVLDSASEPEALMRQNGAWDVNGDGVAAEVPSSLAPPPPPAVDAPAPVQVRMEDMIENAAVDVSLDEGFSRAKETMADTDADADEFDVAQLPELKTEAGSAQNEFAEQRSRRAESASLNEESEPKRTTDNRPAVDSIAQTSPAKPASEDKSIGGRTFSLENGVWTQFGYRDQELTRVERGSARAAKIFETHPSLGSLRDLEEPAIFLAGRTWYRLENAEQPETQAPMAAPPPPASDQ